LIPVAIMHVEFLVEEPSIEAAFNNLLPKILGDAATYQTHVYQGKQDLLDKLPARLHGYRSWLPPDWKIVVLLDEDRQDCHRLKADMEQIARRVGFFTKMSPDDTGQFQVINRIAVEELEAWFFGDMEALHQAYPRISESLHYQARYRDPDAIAGGTAEALERLLVRKNYYPQAVGLPKIEAARKISQFMEPARNRCHSFRVFYDALLSLLSKAPVASQQTADIDVSTPGSITE